MRARRRWLDYLQFLAVKLVSTTLAMFPLEATLRVMRLLGRAWFSVPRALPGRSKLLMKFREHRARAERHIRESFPEWPEERVSQVARESMEQLAMLAVELLLAPRLVTRQTWARYIRLGNLDEAIRILLDRRGCIMLTGHYGNWELLGFVLAVLGFDIVAVMRPLDNDYLNRYLLDRRERSGLRLLYKKGATQSAGDVIESRGALCFIADQNAGSKGLFVDFFGRKASTYKSIGLLAMEHQVPIIVGCARRIGPGFHYEIHATRVIQPAEWQDRDDPLLWITQEYSRAMEAFIREAPGQYLWIHRRWKSRPKGEKALEAAIVDA